MPSLASIWPQRNIVTIVAALAILLLGAGTTLKITTDHLLRQDATSTARSWARFLAASVTDLEQIAGGEQPSAASMAFFLSARNSGEVFHYEIFNRNGYSQFVSTREKIALVDLSEYSPDAARSAVDGLPIVDVREEIRPTDRHSSPAPMSRSRPTVASPLSLRPTWMKPSNARMSTIRS